EFDHLLDIDRGIVDGLVLAELPVGDMQICYLDSTDDRVTGGTPSDRLRVVHGGRNQIVKIESLDVKSPPHLLAACAQQINHNFLIRNRIEGGSRFWPGCNLTECQGNSENLDKNGVHVGVQVPWDFLRFPLEPLGRVAVP